MSEDQGGGVSSVLFSGAVSAALVTGALGVYEAGFESEQNIRTNLVKTMLESDDKKRGTPTSGFRTVLELGGFGDISTFSWRNHAANHPGSLPRFYHSGYIWSPFYPNLPQIKRAMDRTGFYSGPYDCQIDARFVLGIMKLQKSGGGSADAIFGKGTLHKLDTIYAEKTGSQLTLEPQDGDPAACGSLPAMSYGTQSPVPRPSG